MTRSRGVPSRSRRSRSSAGPRASRRGLDCVLGVAVENAALRLAAARTAAERLVALPGGAESTRYRSASASPRSPGRRAEAQRYSRSRSPSIPIARSRSPSSRPMSSMRSLWSAPCRFRARSSRHVDPAAPQISVDGTDVGRAPLEVDVTRGQHIVVAREASTPPPCAARRRRPDVLDPRPRRDDEVVRLASGPAAGCRSPRRRSSSTPRSATRLDEVVLAADTSRRRRSRSSSSCAGTPARCSAVVDIGYGDRSGLAAAARQAWDAARTGELRYPPSVRRSWRAPRMTAAASSAAAAPVGRRRCGGRARHRHHDHRALRRQATTGVDVDGNDF